eukprot:1156968-Pelagomonas_calceolata.AAC.1
MMASKLIWLACLISSRMTNSCLLSGQVFQACGERINPETACATDQHSSLQGSAGMQKGPEVCIALQKLCVRQIRQGSTGADP